MTAKSNKWGKGRGKSGILIPLLGSWVAIGDTEMGKMRGTRAFTKVLGVNISN